MYAQLVRPTVRPTTKNYTQKLYPALYPTSKNLQNYSIILKGLKAFNLL